MRIIDADTVVTVQVFDEMYEEYNLKTMTIAEALDLWTEEGCPSSADADAYTRITGLMPDAVSREDTVTLNSPISIQAEMVAVVRCNECKWYQGVHGVQGHAPCEYFNKQVLWNDFCSWGELADKTKYPATYNTNTKCGGCVHLDELGRCLNFMLAKDDRSCWRGSWENNNGELAEQTDEVHKPDYSYEAEMCKRLSEQTEYKLPGHDEVMEALNKLKVGGNNE